MTWFEAEQIDSYLKRLERLLDEWRLAPFQMRLENAEVQRVLRKLGSIPDKDVSSPFMRRYVSDLRQRLFDCRNQIQERLKR